MNRTIEIREKAEKYLRSLGAKDSTRILKAIYGLRANLSGDIKKLTNHSPSYRLRVGNFRVLFDLDGDKIVVYRCLTARMRTGAETMTAQIIQKGGKKEFAVIPYRDFVRMQEELDDLRDLHDLRKAKADPKNKRGKPIEAVAAEMGIELT